MQQGLLIVDIQNDYFTSGAMELDKMEQAADKASKLLEQFRTAAQPVIHIQHISNRPGATFFLPDTDGVAIHESVAPNDGESVIQKHFPNSFRGTGLHDELSKQDINRLVIVGAMSHMCIDATTRAAFDQEYDCIVIEDACATRDLAHKDETISARQVHSAFMAALAVTYAKVISLTDYQIG